MLKQKTYDMQPASVDAISAEIVEFLTEAKVERNIVVQNRLFAEEILNSWIEAGVSKTVRLSKGLRLGRPVIYLEAAGAPLNVFEQRDEGSSMLMQTLLSSLGQYPTYSYRNGKNIIQLSFPKEKKNKLVQILIAIALAIAVGCGINYLMPQFSGAILSDLVNPLYTAAFRVLGFISGPLILLSVMWGIYGIGDSATLNLVGKRLISVFLAIIFAIAFVTSLSFPLFSFDISRAAGGSSSFKAIFEMILDIVPPNIVEPFISGNTLHIIFCAVIVGIAMLYLGKRVSTVADVIEEINCIVQFLMSFISSLMPYFVFLVVLRLILNNTMSIFTSVWVLFVIFIAAALVLCAAFTIFTSLRYKVSPLVIIKKSIPTFLIAITTASSAAAFSSNMETCEKKFGIDSSFCAFGIPLGMVMFKTSTTAYYVLVSFFFAKQFGVAISPDWLLSAAFVSAVLAIATPPIPGGGVAAYTMLFARLGIPDEALSIVLSMDIIFDFVRTAANMYNLPLALLAVSSTMGKLNVGALRRR